MSRYAVVADIARYVPTASISSIDSTTQQNVLDDVSTLADSFLGSRYKLPLTSYGSDLTRNVCQIAVYDLMCLRGFFPDGPDQNFKDRNDAAMAWLRGVSSGAITPSNIADSSVSVSEGAPFVISVPPRGW